MTRYTTSSPFYIGQGVDTPDGPGYVLKVHRDPHPGYLVTKADRDAWEASVDSVDVRLFSEPFAVGEVTDKPLVAKAYLPEVLSPRRAEPTVSVEDWIAARATPGFKPKATRRPSLKPPKLSPARRAELYAIFNVTEESLP